MAGVRWLRGRTPQRQGRWLGWSNMDRFPGAMWCGIAHAAAGARASTRLVGVPILSPQPRATADAQTRGSGLARGTTRPSAKNEWACMQDTACKEVGGVGGGGLETGRKNGIRMGAGETRCRPGWARLRPDTCLRGVRDAWAHAWRKRAHLGRTMDRRGATQHAQRAWDILTTHTRTCITSAERRSHTRSRQRRGCAQSSHRQALRCCLTACARRGSVALQRRPRGEVGLDQLCGCAHEAQSVCAKASRVMGYMAAHASVCVI